MNADRRLTARICVELIQESAEVGEMSERAHQALSEAIKHLQAQEFWQLKNQERHAGSNPSTDKQLAICRIALPALELAAEALVQEDYSTVIDQLTLAMNTDGAELEKSSKKGLAKARR